MKIATLNINNINRRLPNLLDWLNSSKPDTVWNELREVVWLVSMITGLSIASVSLAIALATA